MAHFCPPGSGSGFRIRIRIHWPDWIRIQSGSGSATLVLSCIFCKIRMAVWLYLNLYLLSMDRNLFVCEREGLSGSGFIFQIICRVPVVSLFPLHKSVERYLPTILCKLAFMILAVSSINIRLHDRRFIFSLLRGSTRLTLPGSDNSGKSELFSWVYYNDY